VATFPDPPSPEFLAEIGAHACLLASGTELWRVYFRGGPHPTTWNTFRAFGPVATARFDHHNPPPHEQERAILYAGTTGPICLAEVFQRSRVIDRSANAPWLVSFPLVTDLRLLDLTGLWPTHAGGSQEINSGDRLRAREWLRAISPASPQTDGLWYRSKMYGSMPAVALYERARQSLPSRPSFHAALVSPTLFDVIDNAAVRIGYTVV
jgi:hypothetical protein